MSRQAMTAALERAQQEIERRAPEVAKASMRQRYHFMGPCGWINDPNGLIYYKGQYHCFYQFNPYSGFWSCMHWGHAVSDDLLHWTQLPVALAPSEWYDNHPDGGCFSGSAIEKDGRLYLIYTGTANNGNGFEQTQNVAYSDDGIHFTKYEGNPVIEPPQGVPHDFFRDPKVWEHDGRYYLVCGAQRDGRAQALLYSSDDLLHWRFVNVLAESRGEWGYMWECPDFFPLADKWVLTCSPMGAGERTVVYFVGDFSYDTGSFTYTVTGELDWGYDFYAPQSLLDSKGRRIMIGWANEWDWMPFWKDWGPTWREGWCGSYAIPREIRLNDDLTLSSMPVEELNSLRTSTDCVETLDVGSEPSVMKAGDGVAFELEFSIDLAATTADTVTLALRQLDDEAMMLKFDLRHAKLSLNRDHADGWSRGESHASLPVTGKSIDVLVLGDRDSIEVFVNGGRIVQSMNVFCDEHHCGITVCAAGGVARLQDIHGYGLSSV